MTGNGITDETFDVFMKNLSAEKPNNTRAKEQELARVRDKIRKLKAKAWKQNQRLKEMAAVLHATDGEVTFMKSEVLRLRMEIESLDDDAADW